MADEIKAAFKVRSVAKSKFTRAETILNEALGATDIPVATIQRRFDDLKKCWTAVQAAHDEYIFSVEQKPEDVTQPADHLLEPYIDELVMRFNQIEVKADRHLEDILNSLDDKATKQSTGAPIKQTDQSLSQDVNQHSDQSSAQDASSSSSRVVNPQPSQYTNQPLAQDVITNPQPAQVVDMSSARSSNPPHVQDVNLPPAGNTNYPPLHLFNQPAPQPMIQLAPQLPLPVNQQIHNSMSHQGTGLHHYVPKSGVVKFEKQKLPPYAGDIRKYPSFKEVFLKYIAPEYVSRPDQLAFVLKSYLCDEVKEEVEHCGEDYDAIWQRLDERYGDKGRLISQIMDEVGKLSANNDDSSTLLMVKAVEKAHRDLIRLGAEEELFNVQTITNIERRMNEAMRQEWAKELQLAGKQLNSKDKFRMLMTHLNCWRSRLEYLMDDVRAPISAPIKTTTHFLGQTRRQEASKRPSCWIHSNLENVHPIWKCKEFISQNYEGRLKLVNANKACTLCLLNTCPGFKNVEECTTEFKCNVGKCGAKHNKLLHPPESISGSVSSASSEGEAKGNTILQMQSI